MKRWRIAMGMPVVVDIPTQEGLGLPGSEAERLIEGLFGYFAHVEEVFSPFRESSETCRLDRGVLALKDCSDEMQTIVRLAEKTRRETDGYFDVHRGGRFNPVGIVKGWAIYQAAERLRAAGVWDFCVDAGGDLQVSGLNTEGRAWRVGIRDPFSPRDGLVKVLSVSDMGVATSGTYERGRHIYDPHTSAGHTSAGPASDEIVSFTVLGPNAYEADRFATAAFAMGRKGIEFIERESCLEGYMITADGMATATTGFGDYVARELPSVA